MNLLIGLAVALACSIVVNLMQLAEVSGLHKDLGAAQTQARQANDIAHECHQATEHLETLASQRAKEAETSRLEAQRLARLHRGRGDAILSAPPAKPGDDCGSAQVRLDSWWEQRK